MEFDLDTTQQCEISDGWSSRLSTTNPLRLTNIYKCDGFAAATS
jgi:hypothetical protein